MKKSEDTKAIMERRKAFVNKVLSKEEAEKVQGGVSKPIMCLYICLTIANPCLSIQDPQICLTIEQ